MRVLDVGTGPGDCAAAAVARGADATGIDIAAAMVELASQRHPDARVRPGLGYRASICGRIVRRRGRQPRHPARRRAGAGRARAGACARPGRTRSAVDVGRSRAVAALQCLDRRGRTTPRCRRRAMFRTGRRSSSSGRTTCSTRCCSGAGFADVEIGSFTLEFPLHSADELMTVVAEGNGANGRVAAGGRRLPARRDAREPRAADRARGVAATATPFQPPMKIAAGTKPGR